MCFVLFYFGYLSYRDNKLLYSVFLLFLCKKNSIIFMDNIILVFLYVFIHRVWIAISESISKNGYLVLNQFIIYVALPALTLFYIPKIEINATLLFL